MFQELEEQIRPTKKAYILPGILMALGLVCALAGVAGLVSSLGKPRMVIQVPGETAVELAEAGTYQFFYEYERVYELDSNLFFTLTNLDAEYTSISYPARYSSNYTVGSRSGELICEVLVEEPGTYLVTSSYTSPDKTLRFVLGRGMVSGIVVPVLLMTVAGVMPLVAGVILLLVFRSQRRVSRRQLEQGGYGESGGNWQ